MKQEFTVVAATNWIVHFLQYVCEDKEEIAEILRIVNKCFEIDEKYHRREVA
jgi:hypothetical protein